MPRFDVFTCTLTLFVPTDGSIWYAKSRVNRIDRMPAGGGQGSEFELPRKNSFPLAPTLFRNGAVLFAARHGSDLGRIDAHGGVRERRTDRSTNVASVRTRLDYARAGR